MSSYVNMFVDKLYKIRLSVYQIMTYATEVLRMQRSIIMNVFPSFPSTQNIYTNN